MKICSIACFCGPGWPLNEKTSRQAGVFLSEAKAAFDTEHCNAQTIPQLPPAGNRRSESINARQGIKTTMPRRPKTRAGNKKNGSSGNLEPPWS